MTGNITTDNSHRKKINKSAPFDLSPLTESGLGFAQLLAHAANQLTELPDFSDDEKIAIMSDFGGEHKEAHFNTYSFLIMAYSKVGPFVDQMTRLRKKHNLYEKHSEFTFKDLSFGPRSRALPEYLHTVDNFIHGALITIAIEKKIETVFGSTKKETYPFIEEQLAAMGLGKWKGATGEKALRICHSIAAFIALTTRENQRLLWYCDNDSINENAKDRNFSDTQKIFAHSLNMYSKHKFDLVGFAKSFDKKSHLDDLLSIPDLAAGVIQDLLKAHKTGDNIIPGGAEKIELLKWISSKSQFLSKITIQISKLENGDLGSGVVNFNPATHNN